MSVALDGNDSTFHNGNLRDGRDILSGNMLRDRCAILYKVHVEGPIPALGSLDSMH